MRSATRLFRRAIPALLGLLVMLGAAFPAHAQERQRIRVDNYLINAELQPKTHRLVARAKVTFTALEDISVATFELNNALRPTRIVDEKGQTLTAERVTQDSTIRVALPAGLASGQSSTLTFDYEGTLLSGDDSPVPGLKLAYIGEQTSYLLYAGRWFPLVGYGTNRFTATMRISAPAGYTVVGSGLQAAPEARTTTAYEFPDEAEASGPRLIYAQAKQQRPRKKPARPSKKPAEPEPPREPPFTVSPGFVTNTFAWTKPSFPGTIFAGQFSQSVVNAGGLKLNVYFSPARKNLVGPYAETAEKEFNFFTLQYGPAVSNTLNIVEMPDDTVPSAWAPEIAAMASRTITEKINYRLLANTIAHQWWGALISPATRDDWWLSDGFARFSEARYIEAAAGQTGYQEAVKDMEVGALAYEAVPLSRVSTLDTFSPEFQALTTEKGAVILNMLRWVIGDAAFDKTMRQFASQYAWKSVTVQDFQSVAEQHYGDKLTWFFTQWLDSTGAPEFKNKYTIYRLGSGKGFRVVGEIAQDLDLFRMPVELKIDTDGRTEMKRIEVVGTNSAYSVDTYGRPRRISIDPSNRVLENSPELKVRSSIMRGQGLVQTGDLAEALKEFQRALDTNKNSSLAHYRIAEVFFLQRNYQAAANAYRESLNGDGEPRWTEVWSHIQLGKIFDITGQRDRATNEYRQALQTNDNTQGALEEARRYLQAPYQQDRPREGN
ncbi:MAG TPA: M1 family aminopeptidase [Terriglobales bacterium]|nr:M1 family aminopeptidase [Terriglobales bacterium]